MVERSDTTGHTPAPQRTPEGCQQLSLGGPRRAKAVTPESACGAGGPFARRTGARCSRHYTHLPSGRLQTRTWARQHGGQPLVTTYAYNDAGELWTVTYSDGTPTVTHTYDRLGRPKTTDDAAGLLTRAYAGPWSMQVEEEVYGGSGVLAGVEITREFDAAHRLRLLETDAGHQSEHHFDASGRLDRITAGAHRADFLYEPGTAIVDRVDIRRTGAPVLRHQRRTDLIGRVSWMQTVLTGPGQGETVVRRDYTYNAANQRTIVEHEDGRAWHYGYDALGQVVSAHKRLSDDPQSAALPGYGFDGIGNRASATRNSR
ncbi:MAG: hypothetical protein EA425_17795, partial [Puniceicoccaceae bacterium]